MAIKTPSLGLTRKAAGKDIPNKVTIGIHHSKFKNPQITIERDAMLPIKFIITENILGVAIAYIWERDKTKLTLASIIIKKAAI